MTRPEPKEWTCVLHGGSYPRRGHCPHCKSGEKEQLAAACAVADAWARNGFGPRNGRQDVMNGIGASGVDALDSLELTTRANPLRKVKP